MLRKASATRRFPDRLSRPAGVCSASLASTPKVFLENGRLTDGKQQIASSVFAATPARPSITPLALAPPNRAWTAPVEHRRQHRQRNSAQRQHLSQNVAENRGSQRAAAHTGGAVAQDCSYTVSVLDVPGVRCVSSAPCSGTYYASGLSQGVGACPSGSSCALLPQTPIMGCAAEGRTDLIYVNADGTLTKDGRSVTLQDATTTTTTTPTTVPSATSSNTGSKSTTGSNNGSKSTTGSNNGSKSSTGSSSTAHGSNSNSNASSGSSSNANSHGGSDASTDSSNSTISDSASASNSSSSSSSSSNSSSSDSMSDSMSGSVVSPGSSSANQQSFNPGSILSDGSSTINKAAGSGLSLGAVIGIVVGCLAVVAIAAGARLLQKGKEAEGELTTPEGAAMEGYNGGGGGSGMTPKENVLLL